MAFPTATYEISLFLDVSSSNSVNPATEATQSNSLITTQRLNDNKYMSWSHQSSLSILAKGKSKYSNGSILTSKGVSIGNIAQTGNFLSALNTRANKSGTWIVDSGASDHMTGDISLFSEFKNCSEDIFVKVANGSLTKVKGTGTVRLTETMVATSVLFVPELDCNLLSVSKITKELQCVALFTHNSCSFQDSRTGKMIGSACGDMGLFFLEAKTLSTRHVGQVNGLECHLDSRDLSNKNNSIILWHYRLGHPSLVYLEKLFPELFSNKNKSVSIQCDICQMSKHTRIPYPIQNYRSSKPFYMIHSDVWGPSNVTNITGSRWFVSFIDDHTRLTWVFLMKEKSEVTRIFQEFYKMVKTQFQTKIKILRSDNGKEYFNSVLMDFLKHEGVIHQSSCINTPQQNGVSERKNRHILEVSRALLIGNNVPKIFWGDAVLTAVYLINRLPSKILNFKTPHQYLRTCFPENRSFTSLQPRVFGCEAFVHIHTHSRSKLDPRAIKCIFLGYSCTQKGYKCYSPITKKFYVSMDVTFHENKPYYPKIESCPNPTTSQSYSETHVFPFYIEPDPTSVMNHEPHPHIESHSSPRVEMTSEPTEPDLRVYKRRGIANKNEEKPLNPSSCPTSKPSNRSSEESMNDKYEIGAGESSDEGDKSTNERCETVANESSDGGDKGKTTENEGIPAETQKEVGEIDLAETEDDTEVDDHDHELPIAQRKGVRECRSRPLYPMAKYISYSKLSEKYRAFVGRMDEIKVPKNIYEALQDCRWRKAVEDELQALQKNKTWEFTDLPKGKKTVGCRWIFTVKYNSDGQVERFKARLVAKGYTQAYGIDYKETFSPVAKLSTVRVLLSLAANLDWNIHQLDVKNAFLNGDLEEEVYMDIPPGLDPSQGVCRLLKSLYGLKQSPRAWFGRLSNAVKKIGFKQCNTDHTLFVKHMPNGKIVILSVYVDDMLLTGSCENEIRKTKAYLAQEFEIKDLGGIKYFLGMEVARNRHGISVNQRKYTMDLLAETGMLECRPCETPMEQTARKQYRKEGIPVDKGRFQHLVGKLIYLAHTRPDISQAVSFMSQFMGNPTEDHMQGLFRILRYLKMTPGRGLFFKKGQNRSLEMFTDADWAGSPTDRRSTTGYCAFVWGNLVCWKSKKQPVVSRSSAESELRAVALGVCEATWIKRMFQELKLELSEPIKLFCDNQSTISMSKDPVEHEKTKHVDIDRHFINEKLETKELELLYIPTVNQVADIFTKALARQQFDVLSSKLGMLNIHDPA